MMAGDHKGPVLTKHGTRPGSTFANITFGLMVKRVLACRDSLMRPAVAESVVQNLKWNGHKSLDVSGGPSDQQERLCLQPA